MSIGEIIWDENYSVGHDVLDFQHKKLLKICNDLYWLIKKDESDEHFHEVLNDLSNYARIHFEYEESVLLKKGYANYKEHEHEHFEYQEHLMHYLQEAMSGTLEKKDLHNWVANWWKDHILVKDMDFKHTVMSDEYN